jgi:cytochrome b6-f complex iron-sulfur subunit
MNISGKILKSDRRGFLNRIWMFCGMLAAAEFSWLGLSFMNFRKKNSQPATTESIITAGPVAGFAPGTVTAVPSGHFYLSCLPDGGLLALSRTCTHLGCSVPWDETEKKFICPCHGSTFSLTGQVLTAPAPRPLDIFPVRIENGIVKVDISLPKKRQEFEPSQVTRV